MIESAMKRGVAVEIAVMGGGFNDDLISEPVRSGAIATWEAYQQSTQFQKHLRHGWQTLKRWSEQALATAALMPVGADLHIMSIDFCPYSMTVVDRRSDDGVMLLSIRTSEKNASHRPAFAIRKASCRATFNAYAGHAEEIFTQEVNARTEFRFRDHHVARGNAYPSP